MEDRWILKEMTVEGFRGFIEPKTFYTSEPFILFDGPQRSGKSSTLVAIEWVLFGDEIAKKAIGIDERRGWKIRNTSSDEARVEIILHKGQDMLKIVRSDKKASGGINFYYELNGIREMDEGKLRALLGIQPNDYFSSVHLHQETIRALLIETPEVRRDSLDRLLGLSDLRNIIGGIKLAKITESLRDADNKFKQIEGNLNAVMASKQAEIQKGKGIGIDYGLSSGNFSSTGASKMAETLNASLVNFAKHTGLPFPDLPSARTLDEQRIFSSSARQSLRKLRDEQPDLKRQNELLEKQSQLQKSQQSYKEVIDELQAFHKEKKHIYEAAGNRNQEKIQVQISTELNPKLKAAKDKRNKINNRAGTIEEAIKYFEGITTQTEGQPCPVCEKPIDDIAYLQLHLQEFKASLEEDLSPISKEIEDFEHEIKRLKDLIKGLDDLDKRIKRETESLNKRRSSIDTVLGYEIKEGEDPIAILSREIGKIEEELKKLESAVKESNQKLNDIEDDISQLEQIIKVLNLEEDIENLLNIKKTEEYNELESRKRELEKFATDVELIRQIIEVRRQESAKLKLGAAKENIAHIFKTLANRPDFSEIEINPNTFEILAVKDGEKTPALSLFNQGDLNCAGLSVFLGLGSTHEVSHNLGFTILDDPSQSLDSEHRENLVSILNSLPSDKQILVSTSEYSLRDLILDKIIRKKTRYEFAPWSDMQGAQPSEVQL